MNIDLAAIGDFASVCYGTFPRGWLLAKNNTGSSLACGAYYGYAKITSYYPVKIVCTILALIVYKHGATLTLIRSNKILYVHKFSIFV